MAASSRRKGLKGEQEVARIWRAAGFEVRGLEGQGDHLVICGNVGWLAELADCLPLASRVNPESTHRKRIRKLLVANDLEAAESLTAGRTLHSEVKRAERLKLPEWLRQAADEAAPGTVPVVAFRRNKGEWYAALPLAALVELAS